MPCEIFYFVCVYRPAFCRVCVFILWTSCLLTNKWIKLNYEEKVWHCSKEVGAVRMTPSTSQWIPPYSRSSLPDKANFQVCIYYCTTNPPNKLKPPPMQLIWDGSASIKASKRKGETAQCYNPFNTMNFTQPQRYQWKSLNLHCFSAFPLKFIWFTRNDLAQGPQTFLCEG